MRNWFFRRNNYFDIYFVAEKFAEKIGCHFFPLKYSKLNQNQSFKINQRIPELQGHTKQTFFVIRILTNKGSNLYFISYVASTAVDIRLKLSSQEIATTRLANERTHLFLAEQQKQHFIYDLRPMTHFSSFVCAYIA